VKNVFLPSVSRAEELYNGDAKHGPGAFPLLVPRGDLWGSVTDRSLWGAGFFLRRAQTGRVPRLPTVRLHPVQPLRAPPDKTRPGDGPVARGICWGMATGCKAGHAKAGPRPRSGSAKCLTRLHAEIRPGSRSRDRQRVQGARFCRRHDAPPVRSDELDVKGPGSTGFAQGIGQAGPRRGTTFGKTTRTTWARSSACNDPQHCRPVLGGGPAGLADVQELGGCKGGEGKRKIGRPGSGRAHGLHHRGADAPDSASGLAAFRRNSSTTPRRGAPKREWLGAGGSTAGGLIGVPAAGRKRCRIRGSRWRDRRRLAKLCGRRSRSPGHRARRGVRRAFGRCSRKAPLRWTTRTAARRLRLPGLWRVSALARQTWQGAIASISSAAEEARRGAARVPELLGVLPEAGWVSRAIRDRDDGVNDEIAYAFLVALRPRAPQFAT